MKTEIRTMLLATDFSPGSRQALDYAVTLASRLNAKLVIANAFELGPEASNVEQVDHLPSRTRREAETQLQAFVLGSSRAGVDTESTLIEGPVTRAILQAITTFKANLLVLGARAIHRGLEHILIGSNVEALILRAPCPTLAVGPRAHADVDPNTLFKKIVYISNLRPAAAAAAPFALALSKVLAIDIEIHQVVREPEQGEQEVPLRKRVEEYCSRLRALLPDVKEEWCNPDYEISRIIAPKAAMDMSLVPSALMVVGVHGAPFLERHFRTSYPYRLLENAVCPIITVRSE